MLTEAMEQEIATIEGLAEVAREQFRQVLDGTTADVVRALRWSLAQGRIDGSTYWRPKLKVGCPLAVVAFAEGHEFPGPVACARPTATTFALEDWAEPIRVDDVPDHTAAENSGSFRAALLVSWIDEFERERVGS